MTDMELDMIVALLTLTSPPVVVYLAMKWVSAL